MTSGGEPWARSIVVGIDGSQAACAALEWAVGEAAATRMRLHAVSVWRLPTGCDGDGQGTERIEKFVQERLHETVVAALDGREVAVDEHVLRGRAETVLVGLSSTASLLVVGVRGQGNGEIAERPLGEVSQRVVSRSCCPVVIVGSRRPAPIASSL